MTKVHSQPIVRCAIYTRKSTNKRLDHDINSLVTQREVSSAYIKSQSFKGWVELPSIYDDGGHSGSGLDRPALKQLMQDIEAGDIDVVVVYKIDRLTRSLADFVRLVEIFDQRNIALVSISQAFDTSDSMGRMILNVLLTFSQFERELIADRVRDSIQTRKRHGKIHGGMPPFGYVSKSGRLCIDAHEEKIVQFIYDEFLRTRRYTTVMNAVRDAGFRSSIKAIKSGKSRGGRLMSPGTVYGILKNPIYIGEIKGKNGNYAGEHQPIVSRSVWEQAQAISAERKKKSPGNKGTEHLLAGLLWDDLGRHMLLDLNWHRGKTYSAYASSNTMWSQRVFRRAYRANAEQLDRTVIASFSDLISDRRVVRKALKKLGVFGDELESLASAGTGASIKIGAMSAHELRELLKAVFYRIEVGPNSLTLEVRPLEVRRFLEWQGGSTFRGRPADWPCSDARYEHEIAVRTITEERWPSLHINPCNAPLRESRDEKLINLVKGARKAQKLVDQHRELSVDDLAVLHGCRPTHFARLIRLNYLAPDIVTSILDGSQPKELTSDELLKSNVPTDWAVQRRLFGFAEPTREPDSRNLFGRGMWPAKQ